MENNNFDNIRNIRNVSKPTLQRLPDYLSYLKYKRDSGAVNISATAAASDLELNDVQVRKDLASVSRNGGRPKTGYVISDLIADIEDFLGYSNTKDAVIVGAGHLGQALLHYRGFESYGLNIIAAFDADTSVIGTCINGTKIFAINEMVEFCQRLKVNLGIITVPAEYAQGVCDKMIESGILAIWNFAPVHLNVPEHILVQNENMAASFAILSKHLEESFSQN